MTAQEETELEELAELIADMSTNERWEEIDCLREFMANYPKRVTNVTRAYLDMLIDYAEAGEEWVD